MTNLDAGNLMMENEADGRRTSTIDVLLLFFHSYYINYYAISFYHHIVAFLNTFFLPIESKN